MAHTVACCQDDRRVFLGVTISQSAEFVEHEEMQAS